MITKAIIPVAGWGTRRLPITKTIEKSMLPVGNRPLVDYSVQELVAAGVTDLYFVVADAENCQVRSFYSDNKVLDEYLEARGKSEALRAAKTLPDGVRAHYITQDQNTKYGTAVPIALAAEEYQLDEPVLVFMGDDFIWNPGGESATESLLRAAGDHSAILGVEIAPEDTSRYGVLSVEDGKLTGVVEKPAPGEAPTNLINVSKYIMTPDLLKLIVDYVNKNDFGARDQEYLVTDPIAQYIEEGGIVRVAPTTGEFLDGGTLPGWLHANKVVCGSDCPC